MAGEYNERAVIPPLCSLLACTVLVDRTQLLLLSTSILLEGTQNIRAT